MALRRCLFGVCAMVFVVFVVVFVEELRLILLLLFILVFNVKLEINFFFILDILKNISKIW